jgi:hypothetical protein
MNTEHEVKFRPVFPIIVFRANYVPGLIRSVEDFSVWPVSSFRKGLIGIGIVDSNGDLFVVTQAEKKGYPKPFFGFSLLCERTLCVDLQLDYTEQQESVETLKKRLKSSLQSGFDDEYDPEDADSVIGKGKTIIGVFNAYSNYLGIEK